MKRLPTVNGQERVRQSRLDATTQASRDAEDWLNTVVNVTAWRGQADFKIIAERKQAGGAGAVHFFDCLDAAIREHNLAVEGEALAHRGPCGDDDEVGGLKARSHRVEFREAGREAREHRGTTGHLLNFFEELVGDGLDV